LCQNQRALVEGREQSIAEIVKSLLTLGHHGDQFPWTLTLLRNDLRNKM
jgi:hypothetical protein